MDTMKYNISPIDGKAMYYTAERIKEAAQGSTQFTHRASGMKCRLAALVSGYATMVSESGFILQGWAGEFTFGG